MNKTVNIGIYGGTFNPPHIAHVNLARAAKKTLGLDLLFIVPTNIPPHKELPENTPSVKERVKLCELAFKGIGEVSTIEVDREGCSYTADTVAAFAKMYPNANLRLIMGTDMLSSLKSWYQPEKILKHASVAVLARNENEDNVIKKAAKELKDSFGARVDIINADIMPADSTAIRKALIRRMGTELLQDDVYEYIIRKRLYGAKPDFDWLRARSYTYLQPKRCLHVAGCEEAAVKLARRWGADEDKAREAAILHDITKKLDAAEQLNLCEQYDIITDNVEKASYKLLHSKTGAELSRDLFGIDDDVYNAIKWHTTGRPEMALLEKIIYMADYIEMSRNFDGLEKLRRAAYEDLDDAMILGLKMSIDDISASGIEPHSNSRDALAYFTALRVKG